MQTYSLEQGGAPGAYKVVVNRKVAGQVIACAEHPGLWRMEDQDGQFMGRSGQREQGAEFLASWFIAEEADWS